MLSVMMMPPFTVRDQERRYPFCMCIHKVASSKTHIAFVQCCCRKGDGSRLCVQAMEFLSTVYGIESYSVY